MEKYFAMCSWMKDIQWWQFGWQMKMDELFHKHWQHIFFGEKLRKRNRMEKFMLVDFENFDTCNVQIIL